nr:ABC transporter substrate-binding protein [Negativibacillus massiliensis]
MTIRKRLLCLMLAASMLIVGLTGCKDSSNETNTVQVDYNAEEEVAKYKDYLGEIPEADKDYVVELGYRNCDHMVAALVGEGSGIFDALGLTVNITKTGQIMEAMASGEMDVGYQGIQGAILSVNNGAPLFMAAANHLGGSEYLVVSNDIQEPEDLIGKKLAIGNEPWKSPQWSNWAEDLGIPVMTEGNYEIVDMGETDALLAMKAGQVDCFST